MIHYDYKNVFGFIPANGHGYDNRLPPWAENLPDLRALSGHHHPHWDQSQEDQTHQGGQVPYICGAGSGMNILCTITILCTTYYDGHLQMYINKKQQYIQRSQ